MNALPTFSEFRKLVVARGLVCSCAQLSYTYYEDRTEHWLEIFLPPVSVRELNLRCRGEGAPVMPEHILKHDYWVDAPAWTGLSPSCGGVLFTRTSIDTRSRKKAPPGHVSVMRKGRLYGKIELQQQSRSDPPIDECNYSEAVLLALPDRRQIFCTLLQLAAPVLKPPAARSPSSDSPSVAEIVDRVLRVYTPLQRNGIDARKARDITVDVLSEEGISVRP